MQKDNIIYHTIGNNFTTMKGNIIKTKEEADELLFWLGTLEAGVLPQGFKKLQDDDGGYCCLGVGVVCLTNEYGLDKKNGRLLGLNADDRRHKTPSWFKNFQTKINNKYGVGLAALNDIQKHSHKKIAGIILKTMHKEIEQAYAKG